MASIVRGSWRYKPMRAPRRKVRRVRVARKPAAMKRKTPKAYNFFDFKI